MNTLQFECSQFTDKQAEEKIINLEKIFYNKNIKFLDKFPIIFQKGIFSFLNYIMHINEINNFLTINKDKKSFDFIDSVFEYLDFSYSLSHKDKEKIPSEGRLICIANHPLGGLDGLALLKAFSEVRKDVKIVVNDILININNLNDLFLPYNIYSMKIQKENIKKIISSLENEEAVIFFPSGEVSRFGIKGIKDKKWNKGAFYFAQKTKSPILPIYINGKNSFLFYLISAINKNFATFLLPHEIFNKKNQVLNIKIGDQIPYNSLLSIESKYIMKYLRKHLYNIGKGKKGIFKTEINIIHPIDRKSLKLDLKNAKLIGETKDEKKIFLIEYDKAPNIMKEISRLRELTFRKVGEGTGKKSDIDEFDKYYKHLILWDDKNLEIVGSYRLGICSEIYSKYGINGLYTATLFKYNDHFKEYIENSVELGRSFIQKKYWNTFALEYLWQGIGAFLAKNEQVKYLIGAVSISNSYPDEAKDMIVYYYKKWFSGKSELAESYNKYLFNNKKLEYLNNLFNSNDLKEDYLTLKNNLKILGLAVPTLYKQYSELCANDGVKFIDFGIDKSFSNCVDGLILIEIDKMKEEKKNKYINKFK